MCEVEIEYCTSEEWLVVFGGYEADKESESSELSETGLDRFDAEYDALSGLEGVTLVPARGQRCLVHSWNGAHFTWRHGGFGTFADLSQDLKRRLEAKLDNVS